MTAITLAVPAGATALNLDWALAPPKPVFGVNSRQFSLVRAVTGDMAAEREYYGPASGVPAAWPVLDAGVTMPVVSIKPDIPSLLSGSLDTRLAAWAKLITPGSIVTAWHEGEMNDGWTPEQILACHGYVMPRVKAIQPACTYAQIVGAYSAKPVASQYPLTKWISGVPDAILMDGYGRTTDASFGNVFAPAVTQIREANATAQLGITETNHSVQASRPAWFSSVYEAAKAAGFLTFMPYWSPDATSGIFAWVASDVATAVALAVINKDARS
jgi:hypothetical protein